MRLVLFTGPSYVFNYKNVIELWVMKTENSQNVFSVSITHNSKIRELSDGNRVMETELSFVKQPFCYGSNHFWVMSYGNRELSNQKRQSKRPLSICLYFQCPYHHLVSLRTLINSSKKIGIRMQSEKITD